VTYSPVISTIGTPWSATLPLSNMQDRYIQKVARSSSAAVADTQFDTDLGVARSVRLLALSGHNFSTAATVRHRGWASVPIIDWATVGDADWTNVGTPTRSAAATTSNGIPLDLIGDDDGAVTEYTYRSLIFTANADKVFSFLVKRSSVYAAHVVKVNDQTTGTDRIIVTIDFSAATPVVTATLGSVISTVAEGTGFRITALAAGVIAANTNRVIVFPANGGAADTAAFYIGDIQAWNAATAQLVYDTGYVAGWPSGIDAEEAEGYSLSALHVTTAAQSARYWRTNVADTGNSAGYVQVGRLIIAGGFQPTINAAYGLKHGWEDDSIRTPTDGGAAVYQLKSKRRTVTFALNNLPETEALEGPFDMQARLGIGKQLFYVHDPEDTTHLHRRSFLAVMRELSPLEAMPVARYGVPFALVEEI
jgi:hypothetical protein